MRITMKNTTRWLVGGVLAVVLTTAGSLWAAAPAAEESIQGLGQPVSESGTTPSTQVGNASQQSTAGDQGGAETDRWHHWYYGRTFYYYRPAPCYYYYYYYTPVVRYRPRVVIFDGADKTADGASAAASEKLTDGLTK
jgi:hypothetical protein